MTCKGRQTVALVREFLEFFKLDFTTAVFDPETNAVCVVHHYDVICITSL